MLGWASYSVISVGRVALRYLNAIARHSVMHYNGSGVRRRTARILAGPASTEGAGCRRCRGDLTSLWRASAQASDVPVSDDNIKEMVQLMDMDEDGEKE